MNCFAPDSPCAQKCVDLILTGAAVIAFVVIAGLVVVTLPFAGGKVRKVS